MNKYHKLPLLHQASPSSQFETYLKCSDDRKPNDSEILKRRLMLYLAFNAFALGFFVVVFGSMLNSTGFDFNLCPNKSEQTKVDTEPVLDNGKQLMNYLEDQSFWARKCNFKLRDWQMGRLPPNSKLNSINRDCESFAEIYNFKNDLKAKPDLDFTT